MSYKFQKVFNVYPEFSVSFLLGNPDYKSLSYERLYENCSDSVRRANYYAKCFEALVTKLRTSLLILVSAKTLG